MFAHHISGRGIPLVFIHAFPLNRHMWDKLTADLSKNFQVICFDMPGFGESELSSTTTTMADMATGIYESLQALGIRDKIILSGSSMGGYVAFEFFRKFPDSIRGMGLISTRPTPDTEAIRAKRFETIELIESKGVGAWAENMASVLCHSPLNIGWARAEILKANPNGICAALRGMAERADSTDLLPKINVPTFIVSGEKDVLIPSTEMKSMAGQFQKTEFHTIEGVGHLPSVEESNRFISLFRHFLKRRVL